MNLLTKFLVLLLFFVSTLLAQSKPYSIFYHFAGTYNDPAAMAREETIRGSFFYRQFFTQFGENPIFFGTDVSFPIKNLYLGAGYLYNKSNFVRDHEIDLNIAYKLYLGYEFEHSLTLGIAPIFEIQTYLPINPTLQDLFDPVFPIQNQVNYFKPNVRLGLDYVYKKLSVRLALPYLLTTIRDKDGTIDNKSSFNFSQLPVFAAVGYQFEINENLSLQTHLQQRLDLRYDVDLLAYLMIKDMIGVGLYYSTIDKMGLVLSGTVLKSITFMYHFSYGFSSGYTNSAGIHELGLLWKIPPLQLMNLKNSRLTN